MASARHTEEPPPEPVCHLRLIGWPHVVAVDVHPLERKDAALLAILALDGATSRARMAALLWPDSPPEVGRGNLRQRLFRLRSAVGRDITSADATILRLADDVHVDLHDLHERLGADPQAGTGDLLGAHVYEHEDGLGEWVQRARSELNRRRLDWLAEHASALEARRELAAALAYARRIVDEEPALEHGHRRLMRLHYLRGDRSAALAAYERCRQVLQQSVGARPGVETQALAELIASSGGAGVPSTPAPLRHVATFRPPRLVGREREWTDVAAGLERAGVVLLVGEPGMGKSRLLFDFATGAGTAWVTASARPGDDGTAYAVLLRLLRAAGQETTSSWPADPSQVSARAADALAPASAPIDAGVRHVALDDLHFADAPTLELLPSLVAQTRERGCRWLLAVRAAEIPPALRDGLLRQDALSLPQVTVGPLTSQHVHELIESLRIDALDAAGWAAPLTRHTGGNPLFLLETIAALQALGRETGIAPTSALPTPPHIGQLISRRLEQLGGDARQLAQCAAIAGQDFDAALAAEVLDRPPLDIAAGWKELEAAQILRDDRFAHDLILEAVRRGVPDPIARLLHAEMAPRLSRRGAPPARVAAHWEAAHRWAEAARAYLAAADAASAASQRGLEAELLAKAARCSAAHGDRAGEFVARERLFHALRHVGRFDAQAAEVDALAALTSSDAERAALLEARALLASDDQQDGAALEAAREAGVLARTLGDRDRALSVVRLEARALARLNRAADALALLQRHADDARSRRDDALGARVLSDLAATLVICDRSAEALPLLDDALASATALPDDSLALEILQHRAWAHACLGETADAVHDYERGRALRQRFATTAEAFSIHDVALARHYKELGRYREALELLASVRAWQSASTRHTSFSVGDAELASCWLLLGQPARALAALREPAADASPTVRAAHAVARARIALAQQQPAAAWLQQAMALCALEGRAYYRLMVSGELSRTVEPDEAVALAGSALEESSRLGLHITTAPLTARLADALCRTGRHAEALPLARRINDEFPRWRAVALSGAEYAEIAQRCLRAAGDDAGADQALRLGLDWFSGALLHVPEAFRDGFRQRNPANRALLAAAARRFGPHAMPA